MQQQDDKVKWRYAPDEVGSGHLHASRFSREAFVPFTDVPSFGK